VQLCCPRRGVGRSSTSLKPAPESLCGLWVRVDGRIVFVRFAHQVIAFCTEPACEGCVSAVRINLRMCAHVARHAPKMWFASSKRPKCFSSAHLVMSECDRLVSRVPSYAGISRKTTRRHEEKRRSDREVRESVTPAMQLNIENTLLAPSAPLSGVSGGRLSVCGVVSWRAFASSFGRDVTDDSNLVDPASSHTLVSKIKPCMSK
jgi:hypothetical protein